MSHCGVRSSKQLHALVTAFPIRVADDYIWQLSVLVTCQCSVDDLLHTPKNLREFIVRRSVLSAHWFSNRNSHSEHPLACHIKSFLSYSQILRCNGACGTTLKTHFRDKLLTDFLNSVAVMRGERERERENLKCQGNKLLDICTLYCFLFLTRVG